MKTTIILLFAMNILDVISTYFAVKSGRGYESTYLVDVMLKNGGYWLFLIVKVVVISIVSVILIKLSKIPHETINFKRATIIATNVFNAIMLYVVINNFLHCVCQLVMYPPEEDDIDYVENEDYLSE